MKVKSTNLQIVSEDLILETEKDFIKVYNLSSDWEEKLKNGNCSILCLIFDDLTKFPARYRKDIRLYARYISTYISKLARVMESVSAEFAPIPGFEDCDL